MSQNQATERRPVDPSPTRPPLHVVLSYLLGAWSNLNVVDASLGGRKGKGGGHDR
jgi:hypothetical protein